MKPQQLLTLLVLFTSGAAHAQVNLDQPINVGPSDHVFRSAVDPRVAYYIPIAINRVGDYQVTQPDDDHLQARFNAGVAPENIAVVKTALAAQGLGGLDVRFLRPADYTIDPNGATDIGPKFEPVLTPLGDLDLAGPMPYSLRVGRFHHLFGESEGQKLLDKLFGLSGADNVGVIRYQFDAVQTGKPQLVRSAVAVFVGTKVAPSPSPAALNEAMDEVEGAARWRPLDAPRPVEILKDKDANCWDTVEPGQYCLRDAN